MEEDYEPHDNIEDLESGIGMLNNREYGYRNIYNSANYRNSESNENRIVYRNRRTSIYMPPIVSSSLTNLSNLSNLNRFQTNNPFNQEINYKNTA